jgi:hypothetical protein
MISRRPRPKLGCGAKGRRRRRRRRRRISIMAEPSLISNNLTYGVNLARRVLDKIM